MNHETIEEQHVAERYVMGKLSPEETERFEEHYFDCPECLERLELAERFDGALRGVAAEEGTRAAVGMGLLAWLARAGRNRQLAVIAGALLFLVVLPAGLLLRQVGSLEDRLEQTRAAIEELRGPRADVLTVRLSPLRGGAEDEPSLRLHLPRTPRPILLRLEIDSSAYRSLSASLTSPDGASAWRASGLEADPEGALNVMVPSDFLRPGVYRLTIDGTAAGGEAVRVAAFAFGAVAAP